MKTLTLSVTVFLGFVLGQWVRDGNPLMTTLTYLKWRELMEKTYGTIVYAPISGGK